MTARAPYIKTTGIAVTSTAIKALPITLGRSYLAIYNPVAGLLSVALGGDTAPAATDYFTIPQNGHFEFSCPPSSAVWIKGAGAQNCVVAEAK